MIGVRIILLFLLAALLSTSSLSLTAVENLRGDPIMSASVLVELDIFSGLPNPVWVLSPAEGALFGEKLSALGESTPKVWSNQLGYRGFLVQGEDRTGERVIRIQRGTVEITIGDRKFYYIDLDRQLERWLLYTGRSVLKEELFQLVEQEL